MSQKPYFFHYPSFTVVPDDHTNYSNAWDNNLPIPSVWTVEEKIHGANGSIIFETCSAGHSGPPQLWVATRNGIVSTLDELSTKAALGAQPALMPIKSNLLSLTAVVAENHPGATSVHVFGEIYGPGVQKGTHYRKDKGFCIFDIAVYDDNAKRAEFLSRTDLIDLCEANHLEYIKILFTGGFEECLAWSLAHLKDNTQIPETLGIVDMPPFVREGHVLRQTTCQPDKKKTDDRLVELSGWCTHLKHRVVDAFPQPTKEFVLKEIKKSRLLDLFAKENLGILAHGRDEWVEILCQDALDECKQFFKEGELDHVKINKVLRKSAAYLFDTVSSQQLTGEEGGGGTSSSSKVEENCGDDDED